MANRSLIYRVQPEELASFDKAARKSLELAREVLERASNSDTFLGRANYKPIPLPHERE